MTRYSLLKKLFQLVCAISVVVLVTGCPWFDDGGSRDNRTDSYFAVGDYWETTIGPAGGELTLGEGGSLKIPAGALSSEVLISAEVIESDIPVPFLDDHIIEFSPNGLQFAVPAELTLRLLDSPEGEATIAKLVESVDESNGNAIAGFLPADTTYDAANNSLSAEISGFSRYVGYTGPRCQPIAFNAAPTQVNSAWDACGERINLSWNLIQSPGVNSSVVDIDTRVSPADPFDDWREIRRLFAENNQATLPPRNDFGRVDHSYLMDFYAANVVVANNTPDDRCGCFQADGSVDTSFCSASGNACRLACLTPPVRQSLTVNYIYPPDPAENPSAVRVSDSQIDVSWFRPSDINTNYDGFELQRSPPWSSMDNLQYVGDVTSYVDNTDVVPGSNYRYNITAIYTSPSCLSRTLRSSVVFATTVVSSSPAGPVNNLAAMEVAGSAVQLDWSPAVNAFEYIIDRSGGNAFAQQIVTEPTTTFTDTTAVADTTYTYSVFARNDNGAGPSSTVSITTQPNTTAGCSGSALVDMTVQPTSGTVQLGTMNSVSFDITINSVSDPVADIQLRVIPDQGSLELEEFARFFGFPTGQSSVEISNSTSMTTLDLYDPGYGNPRTLTGMLSATQVGINGQSCDVPIELVVAP